MKYFLILMLVLSSGCKVIYTSDDVYYSLPTQRVTRVPSRTIHPRPLHVPTSIIIINTRPHTRRVANTPRRVNLETYKRPNQNPKYR